MAEEIQDTNRARGEIASPPVASVGGNRVGESCCPICGRDSTDPTLRRFGQYFCSEAHVAEFAREVRASAGKQDILAAVGPAAAGAAEPKAGTPQKKGGLSRLWKMGACCGGILLLLVAIPLLGTGGLGASFGLLLTLAAFLACPIGMYFAMRGMTRMGQHGGHGGGAEGPGGGPTLPDEPPGPKA